jgi:type III restriction enzyme
MQFKFKIQQHQTDAVNSVIDVFFGQELNDSIQYKGSFSKKGFIKEDNNKNQIVDNTDFNLGFSNSFLNIDEKQILENIRKIQKRNNIQETAKLSNNLSNLDLSVEMETGTGKTYVYTKTVFELNKKYGFSKFIIIVPSVAIREGVLKSLKDTEEHFMDQYGKKARFFIYNSKNLDEIEHFSSSSSIQIMIINIQSFNSKSIDARKIYEELDEFQSRKPIDVISSNNPILILDEPQKMSGNITQESIKSFKPLFTISYSATHKIKNNLIYVLDALDAYNNKLVKKIEVKGFTIRNLKGIDSYIYLESILIDKKNKPIAKIEFEIKYGTKSINRETRLLNVKDNLYEKSNRMEQYKNGYIINEIDPINDKVTLVNGLILKIGEVRGDVNEDDLRRIQIRETIKSHIEKESNLFFKGIKVLSLFFIDEVNKYRKYNENNEEINGFYGEIFEDEYKQIINDYLNLYNNDYTNYLKSIEVNKTHKGYFSIDKKGRKVNSILKRGSDISDDESTYNLILKDKEKLLSFEEPTRFIFSHSALREGWDNPNVFQICTLRYTNSSIQKHQEVGRGSRLSVNLKGERMDINYPNIDVHEINKLTVIANESYEEFVKNLQNEIKNNLFERATKANPEYFFMKKIYNLNNESITITKEQANRIYKYLILNNYLDENDIPNDKYLNDLKNDSTVNLSDEFLNFSKSIHKLIERIFNPKIIDSMFENASSSRIIENSLNDNFYKKEFQSLWKAINNQYSYFVKFDTKELIKKSIININKNLNVNKLIYTVIVSEFKPTINAEEIKNNQAFENTNTLSKVLISNINSNIKYDLIEKICQSTSLTRKTVGEILISVENDKLILFKENPEEFINNISKIINEEKATLFIEHIKYNKIEEKFDSNIFTESKTKLDFKNAIKANKHIKDYVFTDGIANESIEKKFALELENATEVLVYAKLPKSFYIPTPVGKYTPDWAIAFKEGNTKHLYFIAETKGSLDSMQLRKIEKIKIECANILFNAESSDSVKYGQITNYKDLLDLVYKLK